MIEWLSELLLPLSVSSILAFGLLSGRPVFDDFLGGAKNGMKTTVGILPTLIGLMTAVGAMRASGLLTAIGSILAVPASLIRFPPQLVPLTLVRLVSNSAATGLLLDLFEREGPDSPVGLAASILMSSTETVFYCISIYFSSLKIRKTRYVLPGALTATAVGIAVSIWLAYRQI
ncbi:MAG: spore maturation protein [Clostridiales bacterium]|nr:spore maturation protein [Clostridiales bacterium]